MNCPVANSACRLLFCARPSLASVVGRARLMIMAAFVMMEFADKLEISLGLGYGQ